MGESNLAYRTRRPMMGRDSGWLIGSDLVAIFLALAGQIFLTKALLTEDYGIYIVVRSCNINYLKPAKFEDKLTIVSTIESITRTSFVMKQIIKRDNELISDAEVRLITVNQQGRPSKIPDILESKFKNYLSS